MYIQDNETIAAISTPRAAGGISVIRISGEKALEIAGKIFTPVSTKKAPTEMDGYTCAYGRVYSPSGEELDDAILTVFKAPRSYTGEDTAELSCHGGIFVTEKVLRAVYDSGAVPAAAGEFTKRAYLNGKMTLTQAESVMDIISAEGSAFHRKAIGVREGKLYRRIRTNADKLTGLLGKIGAWIDYPEDDIPAVTDEEIIGTLTEIKADLTNILSDYDSSRILRAGIDTVICGKPNVGKSTLMNMLSGCEKSIVTEIAGTTRDIVEESVRLGELVLKISDTAGIHETDDIVEGAGIEKAKKRMQTCDLIIAMFDSSTPLDSDDKRLIDLCKNVCGVKVIACINKTDKENRIDREYIKSSFENTVELSAENGDGIDDLRKILEAQFMGNENIGSELAVNERQKQCAERAAENISEALDDMMMGMTLDAVNIVLDDALNSLLELTGERASENVVAEVFSHFCVGK